MKSKLQIKKIATVGGFLLFGSFLFKWLPMKIWGNDILFDASAHIMITCFALYVLWFFIDQNKNWHFPFFIFSALVLFIISIQRIEANAHNDIGLLLGLVISFLAIGIAERKKLKGKFQF